MRRVLAFVCVVACDSGAKPPASPGVGAQRRGDASMPAPPDAMTVTAGDAAVTTALGRCPSTVAGAHTTGRDVPKGIAVDVTATSADAIAAIRERAHRVYGESHYFTVAMEPPGWMEDDFFSDSYGSDTFRAGNDDLSVDVVQKAAPACPIRVRFAGVKIVETDGGITITMTVPAKEVSSLRNSIRSRIARLPQ